MEKPLALLLALALTACAGASPATETQGRPPAVTLRTLPPVDLVARPVPWGASYRLEAEQALAELAWEGTPVEGPPLVVVPEDAGLGTVWLAVPATAAFPLPAGWRALALPALEVAVLDATADPLVGGDADLARHQVRLAGYDPHGPVLLRLGRDGVPTEVWVSLSGTLGGW